MAQETNTSGNERPWIGVVPSLREIREHQQLHEGPLSWDAMTRLLGCRYPLHAAAYHNRADVCAHLLFHFNNTEGNGDGDGGVKDRRGAAIVDIKTDRRTEKGETALHVACAAGHVDVVHVLIQQGRANVHQLCAAGWSPLRKAVKGGHARTVMYLLEKCGVATPETVLMVMIGKYYNPQRQRGLINILLRHKVNLRCRDHRGNTIFHIAAKGKQHELLTLLLHHQQLVGGHDNDENKDNFLEDINQGGHTPLSHLWHSSMCIPPDSAEEARVIATARVLLHGGANVHVRLDAGVTISLMHIAMTRRRIALLIEYGMDINETTTSRHRWTALNYQAVLDRPFDAYLEHGADVTIPDTEDLLPLHWACFHLNHIGLRQLLQLQKTSGAGANATFGPCHRTTMHIIVTTCRSVLRADLMMACIQILREHSVNLNAVDTDCGWTALHHAAFRSLPPSSVEALLACGADVSIRDKAGRTALHLLGLHFDFRYNVRLHGLVDILMSLCSSNVGYTEYTVKQLLHESGYPEVFLSPTRLEPTGSLRVAQALMTHGASAVALDHAGNLPFFLAASMERVDATFAMIKTAAHEGLFLGNLYRQGV